MSKNFLHKLLKPFNFLIPKSKSIYAVPLTNCSRDCYDFINYTGDNLLCVVRHLFDNHYDLKIKIYLETFSEERFELIKEYIKKNTKGKLKVVLLLSHITKENKKINYWRAFKNLFKRFRSKIWLSDTGHVNFYEKVKRQHFYVMNYGTPFKKEEGIDQKHNFMNIDAYIHTSELCAHFLSAEYIANYYNSRILGFPRNDTLFNSPKKNQVWDWLKTIGANSRSKVIVYAPTYREYHGAYDKGIMGYDDVNNTLEEALSRNNCFLVVKMHPKQEIVKSLFSEHIVEYPYTYDFSLYDLLAEASLLISDYSSIMHDFILINSNVVLNWFDNEKYDKTRGFAFDPIDNVCPGKIVKTHEELVRLINDIDLLALDDDNYRRILNDFHKHIDSLSTKRVCDFLIEEMRHYKACK